MWNRMEGIQFQLMEKGGVIVRLEGDEVFFTLSEFYGLLGDAAELQQPFKVLLTKRAEAPVMDEKNVANVG